MMNDRRGHRKLRLTSRKRFKPKPKKSCEKTSNDIQFKCTGDIEVNELMISVPISAYSDSPTSSVESLQSRFRSHGILPSGMELSLCHRW